MKKVFIVVDMQVDFVTGSLGTGEAQAIVPRLCEKLQKEKEPRQKLQRKKLQSPAGKNHPKESTERQKEEKQKQ